MMGWTTSEIYVDGETHGQTFVMKQQYAHPSCAAAVISAVVLKSTLYPKRGEHRPNGTQLESQLAFDDFSWKGMSVRVNPE